MNIIKRENVIMKGIGKDAEIETNEKGDDLMPQRELTHFSLFSGI